MANANEQWLLGGDCTKCRRQKYCQKDCKVHGQQVRRDIHSYIMSKTKFGVIQELLDDAIKHKEKSKNGRK